MWGGPAHPVPRLCHPLSRVFSMDQLSFASGFLIFLPALSSPSPDACRCPQLALSSLLQPALVLAHLRHHQAGAAKDSGSTGSPVLRAGPRPKAPQPAQVSTGALGDEECRGPTPGLLLRLIIMEGRKERREGEDGSEESPYRRPPHSSSKVLPRSPQLLQASLPQSLGCQGSL